MNPSTNEVQRLRRRGQMVVSFVILALFGIWPALSNGQPFFYADTPAYVRGADLAISRVLGNRFTTAWAKGPRSVTEPLAASQTAQSSASEPKATRRIVLAGRSIIYGALLYIGEVFGGMWFSILAQSLIATYLIFIFTVRALQLEFRYFLMGCAVLFLASPLPFFASFLMPDVFAGFLILAFAILATSWDRLSRFERAFTAAVVLFAVLSHATHLLLLVGLTVLSGGYVVFAARAQWISPRRLVTISAASVMAAILWEVAFSAAVSRAFGSPPVRPPFIMAKLISIVGEPGVAEVCASNHFVVCRFQDRFSSDAEAFLWSTNERIGVFNVVDAGTKRLLSDEQSRFALAIIPSNLGHILIESFYDALRQLTHIGLSEYFYGSSKIAFLQERLPSGHFDRLTSSLAAHSDSYLIFGRKVLYATAVLSSILTALLLSGVPRLRNARSAEETEQQRIWRAATYILLVGITLNAIICGALSVVNHRYEARVIWLIQLTSVTGVCLMAPHWLIGWLGHQKIRRLPCACNDGRYEPHSRMESWVDGNKFI